MIILTKEQEIYIKSNFGILKMSDISKKLGIPKRCIQYFCTKNKLKLTKEQKNIILKQKIKKYSQNDLFFNSFNSKSVYWAGFIAADGYIIRNTLNIKLKSTDKFHLLKFIKDLNSNRIVLDYKGKRNNTITYSSQISLTSDQIVKDLYEKYNIVPNKSLILSPPNITDITYTDCFIKGYFDGDGTIYWKDNRFYCIRFYGTKDINEWIKKRMDQINKGNSGSIFKKNNIWCFELNTKASKIFIQHFKKIYTPELTRKWEQKYLNFL
jgi:hypothetical protein